MQSATGTLWAEPTGRVLSAVRLTSALHRLQMVGAPESLVVITSCKGRTDYSFDNGICVITKCVEGVEVSESGRCEVGKEAGTDRPLWINRCPNGG